MVCRRGLANTFLSSGVTSPHVPYAPCGGGGCSLAGDCPEKWSIAGKWK